jgi:hypothetical protein
LKGNPIGSTRSDVIPFAGVVFHFVLKLLAGGSYALTSSIQPRCFGAELQSQLHDSY